MKKNKNHKSISERTITGMLWSSVHRFGTIIISFIANIVLARLLIPEDFGIIAMLMVFIAFSDTIVNGGFAAALIQKKEPNNDDYSTIFYWNLITSIILFIVLILVAPAIARFYSMHSLTPILRVLGLVLIFNAFNIIQTNQLIKQLDFKRLAKINIATTLIGAFIGISMAFAGYGVWSLVGKMLSISVSLSVLLWFGSSWRPSKIFSVTSFKELFGFGFFVFLSNVIITLNNNVQALIIGKVFSAEDLGYYRQARNLESVPNNALTSILNQVAFPVFSQFQDDHQRLKKGMKAGLKSMVFLNFPMMILMMIVAEPLILILFSEKWSQSIPYFQLLCISGLFLAVNAINRNVIKALGKGKVFFGILLANSIFGIIALIVGLEFGMEGILWSIVLTSFVFFIVYAVCSGKIIRYGLKEQIKDVLPAFLLSLIVGILTFAFNKLISHFNIYVLLVFTLIFYVSVYFVAAQITKMESFYIYHKIIKDTLTKLKH